MGGKSDGGGGSSGPPLINGVGNFQQYQAAGGEASSEAYYSANPGAPGAPPPAFEFPEFALPDFGALQAQQSSALAEAEKKRIQTQGLNDRDTLYSDYISAAESATDFINQQVTSERSNAALLGIDYTITDDQKGQRISDYFATIWGAGDQTRLQGLFDQFGDPKDFTGFSVQRGEGNAGEATGETARKKQPRARTLADQPEDEAKLDTVSILGG